MPTNRFKLHAIDAVVDLFAGQPRAASDFTPLHVGSFGSLFAGQVQTELGVGNRQPFQMKLHSSTRDVQSAMRLTVPMPPRRLRVGTV